MNNSAISARRMRKIDKTAVSKFLIPALILMENAGRSIAEALAELIRCKQIKEPVLFVCGSGNNGGDGFVAARHLSNMGFKSSVVLVKSSGNLKGEALLNFRILKKMGMAAQVYTKSFDLKRAGVIIDCILGTGASGILSPKYNRIIGDINSSKRPVVAVDLPSGLDADNSRSMGNVVKASFTFSLGANKKVLCEKKWKKFAGKVSVLYISLPKELLK
jgi:hydroxyethylthiazole kinase-like uncharacterized protein yjeF